MAFNPADYGEPVALFEEVSQIEQISLTFDQLGRPLVFYRIGADTLKLYWYDPIAMENTVTVLATGVDPTCNFDFPQDTSQSFSDALLFYVRGDRVYMRIQRDRFAIEYPCPAESPGITIDSCGLRIDNRFQVVYQGELSGYVPPVVPPPPVVIIQPGDPEPEPEPGEPPPIVIVEKYGYQNSWGSYFNSNYNIDVVNDSFKIGFTLQNAMFPRYSERGDFAYKQGQYMFGTDDRRQLYCYVSRDTRNNKALITLRRGYDEHSGTFEFSDFNGKWEFEFSGLSANTIVRKDGEIVFSGILSRPRPNKARLSPIAFAGCASTESGSLNIYPFHGIVRDCFIERAGNRIDWAVDTKGQPIQPATPGGNSLTIVNHRPQNWAFITD